MAFVGSTIIIMAHTRLRRHRISTSLVLCGFPGPWKGEFTRPQIWSTSRKSYILELDLLDFLILLKSSLRTCHRYCILLRKVVVRIISIILVLKLLKKKRYTQCLVSSQSQSHWVRAVYFTRLCVLLLRGWETEPSNENRSEFTSLFCPHFLCKTGFLFRTSFQNQVVYDDCFLSTDIDTSNIPEKMLNEAHCGCGSE